MQTRSPNFIPKSENLFSKRSKFISILVGRKGKRGGRGGEEGGRPPSSRRGCFIVLSFFLIKLFPPLPPLYEIRGDKKSLPASKDTFQKEASGGKRQGMGVQQAREKGQGHRGRVSAV